MRGARLAGICGPGEVVGGLAEFCDLEHDARDVGGVTPAGPVRLQSGALASEQLVQPAPHLAARCRRIRLFLHCPPVQLDRGDEVDHLVARGGGVDAIGIHAQRFAARKPASMPAASAMPRIAHGWSSRT